jgi:hypothetical protein
MAQLSTLLALVVSRWRCVMRCEAGGNAVAEAVEAHGYKHCLFF